MQERSFRWFWSMAGVVLVLLTGSLCVAQIAPNAPANEFTRKIKVACVGDSITQGSGTSAPRGSSNAYPSLLQRMLGEKYEVRNFGVGGATLLNSGDKPYQKQRLFTESKAFDPDVVVIMLGTNDTKPQNWKHEEQFVADYRDLVSQYAKLESKPRLFLCQPCVVPGSGNFGINEENIEKEMPMIEGLAKELSLGVIDIHEATKGHEVLFPDRVHPNNAGAEILAGTVYQALMGKAYAGATPIVAAPATGPAATQR